MEEKEWEGERRVGSIGKVGWGGISGIWPLRWICERIFLLFSVQYIYVVPCTVYPTIVAAAGKNGTLATAGLNSSYQH